PDGDRTQGRGSRRRHAHEGSRRQRRHSVRERRGRQEDGRAGPGRAGEVSPHVLHREPHDRAGDPHQGGAGAGAPGLRQTVTRDCKSVDGYGVPMADASDAEVLDRLLADRFSCRGFTDEAVDEDVIVAILESAARTPSWCNVQPWQVDVVSGEAVERLRAELMADPTLGSDYPFPPGYEGEYAERRREVGWQLYRAVGVERGDRDASAREMLRNFEFFGAPHVAIITAPEPLGTYAAIDCGLFVQSFLLAAQARGVATVAQAALAQK